MNDTPAASAQVAKPPFTIDRTIPNVAFNLPAAKPLMEILAECGAVSFPAGEADERIAAVS